jgi:hypothetical protein
LENTSPEDYHPNIVARGSNGFKDFPRENTIRTYEKLESSSLQPQSTSNIGNNQDSLDAAKKQFLRTGVEHWKSNYKHQVNVPRIPLRMLLMDLKTNMAFNYRKTSRKMRHIEVVQRIIKMVLQICIGLLNQLGQRTILLISTERRLELQTTNSTMGRKSVTHQSLILWTSHRLANRESTIR